jgi:glycosidase
MLSYSRNGDAGNDRAGMRRWVHPNCAGGDLPGVLSKVGYLKSLGSNAVWLSPMLASDTSHGYDVMNYYRVSDAVSVPRDAAEAIELYRTTGTHTRS